MTASTTLAEALSRIERWFADHHDDPDGSFFLTGDPMASGALAELYRRWGGQRSRLPAFYDHFVLLSPREAAREKEQMDELLRAEGWGDAWWNTAWQPFASDGAGQLLVLDTETGAVLEFLHDDDARPLRADSIEGFFARVANELESGKRQLRGYSFVNVAEHEALVARREVRQKEREEVQAEAARRSRPVAILVAVLVLLAIIVGITMSESSR